MAAENPLKLTKQTELDLKNVCDKLLMRGKGLIAADEPIEAIGAKLKQVGLNNSEENRRKYRQLLIESDFGEFISGIILDKETLYQSNDAGLKFVEILNRKGILPGINVDLGLVEIPFTDDHVTQGLDGLHLRCAQFRKDGAQFAKWRVAFKITDTQPTHLAIKDNAYVLARYAATCQLYGLVPIVEPDLILDGSHDIEQCQKVYEIILAAVYKALFDNHVYLEGTLLKTAFITPGANCTKKVSAAEVGVRTIQTLMRCVPAAVPGIVFLSGGLSEKDATDYLAAVNQEKLKHLTASGNRSKCQWVTTFCYGRALQTTAWKVWQGKQSNQLVAQQEILKRAKANSSVLQ